MLNLWGFFQSYIVSRTTEHVSINFVAELSPWSGATAWVEVGTLGQELKLALDFSEGLTRLWTDCPLFVEGGCIMNRLGDQMELITLPNQERSQLTFVRVGSGPLFHSDYRDTLRNRDVAGYVGVGRTSVFFSGKVISLSRDSNPRFVRFRELDEVPHRTRFFHRSFRDPRLLIDGDSWTFRGQIGKHDVAVTFDLVSSDIVIPPRLLKNLSLEVDQNGRVYAPCSEPMLLEIQVDVDICLTLPYGLDEAPEFTIRCATRFVVLPNISTVIIGRNLLDAVDSLVFDFESKRFGFLPIDCPIQSIPVVLPIPFNPVVSVDHRLVGGSLVFERTENLSDGFILTRTDALYMSELDGELGGSLYCWSLQRISFRTDTDIDPALVDIPGSFDSMELVVDHQSARFEMHNYDATVRTKPMKAVITRHQNQMFVCWIDTVKYAIANPKPVERIRSDANPERIGGECPVCYEPYQEGDSVQSLNGCDHQFHLQCISRWLFHLEHGCPICRCPVPKVRRTREPTKQPTQEYPEPQDEDVSCVVS